MEHTPAEVKELIRRHLTSVDHLEVLMRLYESSQKAFPVETLRQLVHLDVSTLGGCLGDLVGAGLVKQVELPHAFQYAPRTTADARAVEALAIMYTQRPVALVRLVYDQQSRAAQSFADAFRLRHKKPDQ